MSKMEMRKDWQYQIATKPSSVTSDKNKKIK